MPPGFGWLLRHFFLQRVEYRLPPIDLILGFIQLLDIQILFLKFHMLWTKVNFNCGNCGQPGIIGLF